MLKQDGRRAQVLRDFLLRLAGCLRGVARGGYLLPNFRNWVEINFHRRQRMSSTALVDLKQRIRFGVLASGSLRCRIATTD
eukprot:6188766-Pleurochrysis_carterae.AAC.1